MKKIILGVGMVVLISSFSTVNSKAYFGERRVCETVSTSCPSGSQVTVSVNTACVDYEHTGRTSALVAMATASLPAQAAGNAGCGSTASILPG